MAPVLYVSEPFTYPGGDVASGVPVQVMYGGTLVNATVYHDSFGTRKANPVRTASDGTVAFYAEPGEYVLRANGVDTVIQVEGGLPGTAMYSYQLTTGSGGPGLGVARVYNDTGTDQLVTSVRVTAVDVSVPLTVDVNIDSVTIFPVPGDRPNLPVASGTGTTVALFAAPVRIPTGSYITVDVDAGTYDHLVVQIFVR